MRNWVVYELYQENSGRVLHRDYDTVDYVEELARYPVTEGRGPVWEAHSRGKTVRLRVLDQGLSEEAAARVCEGMSGLVWPVGEWVGELLAGNY